MEDFQDGHHDYHIGYHNKMILAILNLAARILEWTDFSNSESLCPIKFQLNPTNSLEGDAHLPNQTPPPTPIPSWFEELQDVTVAAILDIGIE